MKRPYTFHATTDTTVKPDLVDPKVYGHHRSAPSMGTRGWAFEEEAGRDLFVLHVNNGAFRTRPQRRKP